MFLFVCIFAFFNMGNEGVPVIVSVCTILVMAGTIYLFQMFFIYMGITSWPQIMHLPTPLPQTLIPPNLNILPTLILFQIYINHLPTTCYCLSLITLTLTACIIIILTATATTQTTTATTAATAAAATTTTTLLHLLLPLTCSLPHFCCCIPHYWHNIPPKISLTTLQNSPPQSPPNVSIITPNPWSTLWIPSFISFNPTKTPSLKLCSPSPVPLEPPAPKSPDTPKTCTLSTSLNLNLLSQIFSPLLKPFSLHLSSPHPHHLHCHHHQHHLHCQHHHLLPLPPPWPLSHNFLPPSLPPSLS